VKSYLVGRTAVAEILLPPRTDWTPWEQIKLDIEDNPVIPVVWKNSEGNSRLLLFWLRILKKGPDAVDRPRSGQLIDLNTQALPGDPQFTVQAVLCWSEYYNGKWQPTKTSDPDKPTTLATYLPGEFDRSDSSGVICREMPASTSSLPATAVDPDHLNNWPGLSLFRNTHSLPVRGEETAKPPPSHVSTAFPTDTRTAAISPRLPGCVGVGAAAIDLRPTTQPPPFSAVDAAGSRRSLNAPVFFADDATLLVSTRSSRSGSATSGAVAPGGIGVTDGSRSLRLSFSRLR
jgi:hypothetical protein